MKNYKTKNFAGLLCATALLAAGSTASATVVMESNGPYTGYSLDASGWVRVTINDTDPGDATQGVDITVQNLAPANAGYFIREIALNSSAVDNAPAGTVWFAADFDDPTRPVLANAAVGPDIYAADGAGRFDLRFIVGVTTPPFVGGQSMTIHVQDPAGTPLNAESFISLSGPTVRPPERASAGGNLMAVLFRGIEDSNGVTPPDQFVSGTVVPEPATIIAGALLLIPFGASAFRVLRKNRKS